MHIKVTHKNHVLAPIVGKEIKQKFLLDVVLRVLKGLINRGFFRFSMFTPSSVQCTLQNQELQKSLLADFTARIRPTRSYSHFLVPQ